MNCRSCQEKSEAYRNGSLPDDIRNQVEIHLKECNECSGSYRLFTIAEKVISEEKEFQSNPFLATRIMAQIENMENLMNQPVPVFTRIMRPLLMIISLAAAIFLGFIIGNMAVSSADNKVIPAELTLMDDAAIESVYLLSND
jgi:predicted anti-sigma-YlaC factor YlaD